jgi:hypothetical protein
MVFRFVDMGSHNLLLEELAVPELSFVNPDSGIVPKQTGGPAAILTASYPLKA